MISRDAFLNLATAGRVTQTFTDAQWHDLQQLVSTDERVRRFIEWEVYGADSMYRFALTREPVDGRPIALPLEARERLLRWSREHQIDVAFVDGRNSTYAIPASAADRSVTSTISAIVERGFIDATAVTKDEWVTEGAEALNRHAVMLELPYDVFAKQLVNHIEHPARETFIAFS